MKRVLIGELGGIVKLGLRELIANDAECEVVGDPLETADVLGDLDAVDPDVVLLDLDDSRGSTDLAMAISASHPAIKVIACSSSEPRMRVFPPFRNGESYLTRMNPEMLIEAVKQN